MYESFGLIGIQLSEKYKDVPSTHARCTGGCPPQFFENLSIPGQKLSCHSGNDGPAIRRIY